MNSERQCEWANLPMELLQMIGEKLKSRIDVFRFRAVCISWRSAVSSSYCDYSVSPIFSHLCPVEATAIYLPFTICCLQPNNGGFSCLVKVLELSSGELHLLDPLSSSTKISQLPAKIGKTVNMLNCRLIELFKGYHLEFQGNYSVFPFRKALFSGDSRILGISDLGKLGFRKFSDDIWINLGSEEIHYDDIVVYQGQFYVNDSLGIVSWIDKSMNLIQYFPPLLGCGQQKNIIESEGNFYVVDSYIDLERWRTPEWKDEKMKHVDRDCVRVDMRVYMLDQEWGTWVQVKSLGNRVFVLGKEYCFSFCARDFPDFEGNCIYFMEPTASDMKKECYVLWVCSLNDGSMRRVCRVSAHIKLFSPSIIWSSSS